VNGLFWCCCSCGLLIAYVDGHCIALVASERGAGVGCSGTLYKGALGEGT